MPVTDAEKNHYRDRFFGAESAEELLEIALDMAKKHPGDAWAMSFAEAFANAIAMERPELLDEL